MEEENSNVEKGTQKMRIPAKNSCIPQRFTKNVQVHENREDGTYSPSNNKIVYGSREKIVNQLPISISQQLSVKYRMSETEKFRNPDEVNDTSKNDIHNIVKPEKNEISLPRNCLPKAIKNTCFGYDDELTNAGTIEVNRTVNKSSNDKMTKYIASKSETVVQAIMGPKNEQSKTQARKKVKLIHKKENSTKILRKTANDENNKVFKTYALRSTVKTINQIRTTAKKSSANTSKGKSKIYKETVPKKPAKALDRNLIMENGHALTNDELKTLYKKFLLHRHFRANPNSPPFISFLDNNYNPMKKHQSSNESQITNISHGDRDKECINNINESTNNNKKYFSENREAIQHQRFKISNSPVFVDLTSDIYTIDKCDASTNTDFNQLNKISSLSNNTNQSNPLVSTLQNAQIPIERNGNYSGYVHCNDTQLIPQSNNYPPFTNIIGLSSSKNFNPLNTWTENPIYCNYATHLSTRSQPTMNNISPNNKIPIFNNSVIRSNHSNMLLNIPNTTLNSKNESNLNTFQQVNPHEFNRFSIFNNVNSKNTEAATLSSKNNVLYNTSRFSLPRSNQNSVINRSNNLLNSEDTVLPAWNNFQMQVRPQIYNSNNNICYAYPEEQTNAASISVNNNQSFLENSMHNICNANVYLYKPNDYIGTSRANNTDNINTQENGMNSFATQTDPSASMGPLPSIHTILPRPYLTGESSFNFEQNIEINTIKELMDINNVQDNSFIDNNHMEQNANSNTNIMNALESYFPILSHFKEDKELNECRQNIGNQNSNAVETTYLQTQTSEASDCMIIDLEKSSILGSTKSPDIQELRQVLADFTKQYPNQQELLHMSSNQSESKYKGSSENLEQTASCITLD